jgi:hypothetical protein
MSSAIQRSNKPANVRMPGSEPPSCKSDAIGMRHTTLPLTPESKSAVELWRDGGSNPNINWPGSHTAKCSRRPPA